MASSANNYVQIQGFEEFAKNFTNLENRLKVAIVQGMKDDVLDLEKVSAQIAPKLEGTLEGSHSSNVIIEKSNVTGIVSYNAPYALRRHEEPYSNRKPYTEYDSSGRPVGKIIKGRGPITRSKPTIDGMQPGRKFLEKPFKKYIKKYQQHIADKISEVIK